MDTKMTSPPPSPIYSPPPPPKVAAASLLAPPPPPPPAPMNGQAALQALRSRFPNALREKAFAEETRIGVFDGMPTNDCPGAKYIAVRGSLESLLTLEGLPGATYSSQFACLAIPLTRASIQAIEILAHIDVATEQYKAVRSSIFAPADFAKHYPAPRPNPLTGETNPPPWAHQIETLAFIVEAIKAGFTGFANLSDMGVGKTRSSIDFIRLLNLRHVLILCTKSAIGQWAETFEGNSFPTSWVHPLRGPLDIRREHLLDPRIPKKSTPGQPSVPFFAILNWDAVSRLETALAAHFWDLIIADEMHIIANRNAQVTKSAFKIAPRSQFRLGLTGTPIGGNLGEIWSQYKFLQPGLLDTSYHRFMEENCIIGGFTGKEFLAVRPEMLPSVVHKIWQIGYRMSKAASSDMPAKVYRRVSLPPSERQQKAYKSLAEQLFAEELLRPGVIGRLDITSALTKSLRLQQVTAGILPTPQIIFDENPNLISNEEADATDLISENLDLAILAATPQAVELGGAKTEWLVDYVYETMTANPDSHILIFTRFRPEMAYVLARLRTRLANHFPLDVIDYIDGSVSGARRDDVRRRFVDRRTNLKILVANVQAAAYSLDLPLVDVEIFHSSTFNYRHREQAEDRGNRMGRTTPCLVIDLVISNTIDNHILRSHAQKKDFTTLLLENGFNRNMNLEPAAYSKLADPSKEENDLDVALF